MNSRKVFILLVLRWSQSQESGSAQPSVFDDALYVVHFKSDYGDHQWFSDEDEKMWCIGREMQVRAQEWLNNLGREMSIRD